MNIPLPGLVSALDIVGVVVNPRSPHPLMASVRIRSVGTGYALSAVSSNAYSTVYVEHGCEAGDSGIDLCVPFRTLRDIVGAMKAGDGRLEVTQVKSKLRVTATPGNLTATPGNQMVVLSGMDDDAGLMSDFVPSPEGEWATFGCAKDFVYPASQVSYAASSDKDGAPGPRRCIRVNLAGGVLSAQATNAWQAARCSIEPESLDGDCEFSILLDMASLGLLRKFSSEMDSCRVIVDREILHAVFSGKTGDDYRYIRVPTAGNGSEHPGVDVAAEAAKKLSMSVVFDRGKMLDAAKIIAALGSDKIIVSADSDGCFVRAPEMEIGGFSGAIDSSVLPSGRIEFATQVANFIGVLSRIPSDSVFVANDGIRTLIHTRSPDHDGFDSFMAPMTM